jgi:hypothetical protein
MKSEHISTATGRRWDAFTSVYYDCHVVSLGQIAPRGLYYDWLTICALPFVEAQWGGISCRNKLDSEVARDVVLLDRLGVVKRHVPIRGDITANMEDTVRRQGYCVARVDSYYHEHFVEFYKQQHRTNGHKVVVIDWDDENYYGIDNVGIKTLIMDFKKDWFIESIRSNLFHVYEKEDTFYHFEEQSLKAAALNSTTRRELVEAAVAEWLAHRKANLSAVLDYARRFAEDIVEPEPRGYAQQHNSYTSALMIETAYTALYEAWSFDRASLDAATPNGETALSALRSASQAWRMIKLLLKGRESGQAITVEQLVKVMGQLVERERAFDVELGLAVPTPLPMPERRC